MPKAVVLAYQMELKLLKAFVKEKTMPLYWNNYCSISDEIRAYNDRMGQGELKKLNPLFEKQVEKDLLFVPKVNSELDAMKLVHFDPVKAVEQVKAFIKSNGMKTEL